MQDREPDRMFGKAGGWDGICFGRWVSDPAGSLLREPFEAHIDDSKHVRRNHLGLNGGLAYPRYPGT